MDDEEIRRDREIIAAAQDGPWLRLGELLVYGPYNQDICECDRSGTAVFIANARTRWPAALAALEEANGACDTARRIVHEERVLKQEAEQRAEKAGRERDLLRGMGLQPDATWQEELDEALRQRDEAVRVVELYEANLHKCARQRDCKLADSEDTVQGRLLAANGTINRLRDVLRKVLAARAFYLPHPDNQEDTVRDILPADLRTEAEKEIDRG